MRKCFCGFSDGPIVLDKPEQIQAYRLLVLRRGLGLEMRGLRLTRGPTSYAIIKREFGLRGSKRSVFDQFTSILRQQGILHDLPQ